MFFNRPVISAQVNLSGKFMVFFLLVAISAFPVFSQKLPKNPLNPSDPRSPSLEEERDSRGDKKQNNQNSSKKENAEESSAQLSKTIQATLCDGRKVTGKWEGKISQIQFHHIREGIRYQKSISLSEISQLKILSWRAEIHKKESTGVAYKMLPDMVQLETKSGESFQKDSGLEGTEFSVLRLENPNGVATLYSMWIDLLYKDGNWYTKLKPIKADEPRTDCFKDVIREISLSTSN